MQGRSPEYGNEARLDDGKSRSTGCVAIPALGALLILAGAQSIKPSGVARDWRAGWPARIALIRNGPLPCRSTMFAWLGAF